MTDYDRGYNDGLNDAVAIAKNIILRMNRKHLPYGAVFQKYDDCRNTTVPTDPATYHAGDDPDEMGGGDTEGSVW